MVPKGGRQTVAFVFDKRPILSADATIRQALLIIAVAFLIIIRMFGVAPVFIYAVADATLFFFRYSLSIHCTPLFHGFRLILKPGDRLLAYPDFKRNHYL